MATAALTQSLDGSMVYYTNLLQLQMQPYVQEWAPTTLLFSTEVLFFVLFLIKLNVLFK